MLLASMAHAQSLSYRSVWECSNQPKVNWYCDEQVQEEVAETPSRPIATTQRIELDQIRTAKQLREELKRREDVAVMEPSESNIKDYLTLWQFTQQKGAVFADTWRRVVWQNPDLDYSIKRPANNTAIKTYDAQRIQNEEKQLRALAKEHGLIFFFRSDCPYCHAMAPTLKILADKYGVDVLGVSVDGKGIAEFPHPRDGRVQANTWGIERVPALFIGSKKTGEHAPIGFGVMSLSEIVNRIFVLTGTQPGENF